MLEQIENWLDSQVTDFNKHQEFFKLCMKLGYENQIEPDYFNNQEWCFHVKNIFKIIGVHQDELVLLESITTGINFQPQCHLITMRKLTKENITERKADKYSSEEIWRMSVTNGNTELGLAEFHEQICEECEDNGELFPYDDTSYREETLYAIKHLSEADTEKLNEIFGELGNDYENLEISAGCSIDYLLKHSDFDLILDEEFFNIIKENKN